MDISTFNPTTIQNIKELRHRVPKEVLYSELSAEASALSEAALGMSKGESNYSSLVEEFTDVLNIGMRILDIPPDWLVGDYKLYVWAKQLDEEETEDRGENTP